MPMLKSLKIKNFRRFDEAEIKFKKVNWIVGPSGSGKSTILAATEYVLSARNEWTDGRGTGIKNQIRNGKERSEIECIFDDNHSVSRTISSKPHEHTGKEGEYPEDIAKACLSCRHIVNMNAKEQKDLFFRYFQPEDSDIFSLLDKADESFPDLGQRFKSYCTEDHSYVGQDIDTLHKIAYNDRRLHKKVLEEKRTKLAGFHQAIQDEQSTKADPKDIDKTKKAIDALRKKLDDETMRIGKSRSDYLMATEKWKALEYRHNTAKQAVIDLQGDIEVIATSIGPDVSEELKAVKKDIETINTNINSIQKEINVFAGDGRCPVGRCARTEVATYNERMKIEFAAKDKLMAQFQTLTKKNNERVEAQKQYKLKSDEWQKAKNQADELGELPPAPVEGTVDYTERDRLKSEIARGTAYLEKLQSAVSAAAALKKLSESQQQAEAELKNYEILVEMFDSLVKALSPDGVKSFLLASVSDLLQDALNEELAFYNFYCKVQPEPWTILISTNGGKHYNPDKFLSKSEKSRVSSVYQKIIAQKSGFPIIGLDGFEIDPIKRRDILNFVLNSEVQSIVCNTSSMIDDTGSIVVPRDLGIKDVATFYVFGGNITQV